MVVVVLFLLDKQTQNMFLFRDLILISLKMCRNLMLSSCLYSIRFSSFPSAHCLFPCFLLEIQVQLDLLVLN